MHAGAERAGRQSGFYLYWNAPTREDDVEKQIAFVERVVQNQDAGLILAQSGACSGWPAAYAEEDVARFRVSPPCFVGFYADLSDVSPDVEPRAHSSCPRSKMARLSRACSSTTWKRSTLSPSHTEFQSSREEDCGVNGQALRRLSRNHAPSGLARRRGPGPFGRRAVIPKALPASCR
jgi:hypothetical protein